ncbi:hypothetical protein P3S54_09415 [Lactobacillus delbrueckii]|uniref:hypothetical protein n=1 Tax=Lactobacillus delbrueckii TaxID=1584 RepID=UPI0023E46E62|nr:hypothetical protein [Lactobacillus delbrueckii]MDF4030503.1 hypothetical protein [Lactobacillus delbrueckii]
MAEKVRERDANSQIARRLYFQSSSYKRGRQVEKGKRGDKRADKKPKPKTKLFFLAKKTKKRTRNSLKN